MYTYTYTLGAYSYLTFVRNEPRLGILLPMRISLCSNHLGVKMGKIRARAGSGTYVLGHINRALSPTVALIKCLYM